MGKLVFARHKQAAATLTDKAGNLALVSADPDIVDNVDCPSLWLGHNRSWKSSPLSSRKGSDDVLTFSDERDLSRSEEIQGLLTE